jgi:hypothetical protein
MERASLDDLRNELAVLRAREGRLSAERNRLHDQIDFGFGSETTREREREISEERRQLHDRIQLLEQRLRPLESA